MRLDVLQIFEGLFFYFLIFTYSFLIIPLNKEQKYKCATQLMLIKEQMTVTKNNN